MSESNYRPSGELQGDTSPIADRGQTTGFLGTDHGVSFDLGATQSFGSIAGDTGSDTGLGAVNRKEQEQSFGSNVPVESFTGSMGSFSAASAAPDEENVNDADAGQPE